MRLSTNKKFPESDCPRTKPSGYFAGLGAKPEILYFAPPGIVKKKQFRPPPRGGNIGNLEAEPSRII